MKAYSLVGKRVYHPRFGEGIVVEELKYGYELLIETSSGLVIVRRDECTVLPDMEHSFSDESVRAKAVIEGLRAGIIPSFAVENLTFGRDEEINKVLNELKLTGTGIEGAKRVLNFYKFGIPVKFERERVVRYVGLFDFTEVEKQ